MLKVLDTVVHDALGARDEVAHEDGLGDAGGHLELRRIRLELVALENHRPEREERKREEEEEGKGSGKKKRACRKQ